MRWLRRIGYGFLGAVALAGALYLGGGELDSAPRMRDPARLRSRLATGGWDAALRLLNPPGAGYDSTNISLSTASGGAVTFTSATPRQYCPDSSGALRSLAANKPCVVDNLSLKVRSAVAQNLTAPITFSDAAWAKTNITLGSDATLDPTGAAATKVSATAAAATVINQFAAVAATSASCVFYVKKGSGAADANTFRLRNATSAADLVLLTLNYDTLALTYTAGSGATVTQYPNGWIRLVLQASAGIVSGNSIGCYPFFFGAVETAGEYAYLFGVDLVPGTTTPGDFCAASAGTCSAETATVVTPAALSASGFCVRTAGIPLAGSSRGLWSFGSPWTAANTVGVFIDATAHPTFRVYDSGAAAKTWTATETVSSGARVRFCYASGTVTGTVNSAPLTLTPSGAGTGTISSFLAPTYVGSLGNAFQADAALDSWCFAPNLSGCQ
jgi:hypothetical protein